MSLRIASSSVVAAFCLFASAQVSAGNPGEVKNPITVKWLIAHEPVDAFTRAAKIFSAELEKESQGELKLEVLTPKDVGFHRGSMPIKKIFALLKSGKVQLSQTVTTGVGEIEPKFFVLDLPFLFRDHDHAQKVLDGEIGKSLLASLDGKMVRGLAFTYSGGFRVVPSTSVAINKWADFKGLKVRTSTSPVAQETLRQLGAEAVPIPINDSQTALNTNTVEAAETTYVRIKSVIGDNTKFLNETQHSLFLTALLVSSEFYNSLSKKNQEILQKVAMRAAKIEREDSVADGERLKMEYKKKGVQIVEMDPAAREDMKKHLQPVYEKFEPKLGKKLVQDILAAR